MSFQVGDEVEYLPHECHAMNRDRNGDYPWVFGLKRVRQDTTVTPPRNEVYVQTLDDNQFAEYRDWLKRLHPEAAEREKANIVFVRPKAPWKAVVAGVNADGTLDLTIESNQGGVTLNYRDVPVCDLGKTPHTCRSKKGS